MKKIAMLFAVLATAGTAYAAETSEFKWNGEIRTRYTNNVNQGFEKDTWGSANNFWEQRAKLGLTMMNGESFSGYVSLVHANTWGANDTTGAETTTSGGVQSFTNHTQNLLVVNEAWGWWKAHDMFALKLGRSTMEIADGAISGPNDWNSYNNVYEGVWGTLDFEPVSLMLFGLKSTDLNTGAQVGTTDDENVNYGVVAGIKTLPEFLKKAEIHLIQENNETDTTPATLNYRRELLRYGLTVKGDMNAFDYRLIADFLTGRDKQATETKYESNMFDINVGYTFTEVMGLRIGAQYHMDSGDDDTADNTNKNYQPFRGYESHKFAGLMDIIGWGNLTYWGLSLNIAPMEDLTAGIDYLMFSRTQDKSGNNISSGTGAGTITYGNTDKDIGSEIDLYATKTYGENFSILGRYSIFTPGAALKNTATKHEDTHSQFVVQGTMTF